jgi:broad specificity phosphatase PhoE
MMIIHLIRHAVHPLIDSVLVGRHGIGLAEEGREQAEALARHLIGQRIDAVQSSPQKRAVETAAIIAGRLGLPVEIVDELDEVDFGQWAGCSFEQLNGDPHWFAWNSARGTTRPTGGETMPELQKRILGHLQRLRVEQPGRRLVLVSHAEVIRAALLHFRGIALDNFAQVEIAPASISTLLLNGSGAEIKAYTDQQGMHATALD